MARHKRTISPLPLASAHNNRHSLMIIAILVFVMTLVLGAIGSFEMRIAHMQKNIQNSFTIEIPHIGSIEENNIITDKVLAYLSSIPEIDFVKKIDQDHLLSVTKPWLGHITQLDGIHIPIMIEAHVKESESIHFAKLLEYIHTFSQDANIEFHNQWEGLFTRIQHIINSTAYGLVACLAIAIVFVVMSLTRGLIFSQKDTVLTLRLLGATQGYIARQLDTHMLKICLIGALLGMVVAIPILFIIKHFIFSMGLTFPQHIDVEALAPLAAIPVLLSVLTITATHLTISKTLNQIHA